MMNLPIFHTIIGSLLMIIPYTIDARNIEAGEPIALEAETDVVTYENHDTENGHYTFYALSDGQVRKDTIEILYPGTDQEEVVHKGEYSYRGTDGFVYETKYYADKTGYHATQLRYRVKGISPNVIKSLVG